MRLTWPRFETKPTPSCSYAAVADDGKLVGRSAGQGAPTVGRGIACRRRMGRTARSAHGAQDAHRSAAVRRRGDEDCLGYRRSGQKPITQPTAGTDASSRHGHLNAQFAVATAASHILERWRTSGGVVASKIPATPYPDDRYRTKMMWWDRSTFANHADPEQVAKIVNEMAILARQLDHVGARALGSDL